MKKIDDSKESQFQELLGMTDESFNTWKETVRIDAIQIPHHAHNWISEESTNV